MPNDLLDAALSYAESGWYVFPCEPPILGDKESGKRPARGLVPNGKDDSTRDPALIRAWWERAPQSNVGIDTARSGLVVLDVDTSDGKLGAASLAQIDHMLVPTLTAITGGGGYHGFYTRPPGTEPFTSLGDPKHAYPGLDIIGNGYVIAAPSRHYTGGMYKWHALQPLVSMPRVLSEVRAARHIPIDVPSSSVGHTPIVEGGRNNALFKLGCALRATSIDSHALRAALHLENRRRFVPPLDDQEVDTIAASVMTRVHPQRDVAAGTIVAADMQELFPQPTPAPWIRDVARRQRKKVTFYDTGSPQLNELLGGGLATGRVLGVIAPPSVGKSAFVGTLVQYIQDFVPCLHVSTELELDELMIRHASARAGWVWRDALKGDHDDQTDAICSQLRIRMIGSDTLDMTDPLGMIAKHAIEMRDDNSGVSPVTVIDYVQLLARGTEEGMRARVGELTMKIRKLAQLLGAPIICVFSTGRGFYKPEMLIKLREMNNPIAYLSAAKESGDIEFDCGSIIFLDVDQLVEGPIKPCRVNVARARDGSPGVAGYRANLATGLWVPEPLAATEMMGEQKLSSAQIVRMDRDVEHLLQMIIKFPTKPWRDLRASCGIGHDRADAAKRKLMDMGKVEYVTESYYDELTRPSRRQVLKVIGNNPGTSDVTTP